MLPDAMVAPPIAPAVAPKANTSRRVVPLSPSGNRVFVRLTYRCSSTQTASITPPVTPSQASFSFVDQRASWLCISTYTVMTTTPRRSNH